MKKIILSAAFLGLGVFGFAQQSKSATGDHTQKKAEHLQKNEARTESYRRASVAIENVARKESDRKESRF